MRSPDIVPQVLEQHPHAFGAVDVVFNDQNAMDNQWFSIVDEYCRSKGYELFRVRPGENKTA